MLSAPLFAGTSRLIFRDGGCEGLGVLDGGGAPFFVFAIKGVAPSSHRDETNLIRQDSHPVNHSLLPEVATVTAATIAAFPVAGDPRYPAKEHP